MSEISVKLQVTHHAPAASIVGAFHSRSQEAQLVVSYLSPFASQNPTREAETALRGRRTKPYRPSSLVHDGALDHGGAGSGLLLLGGARLLPSPPPPMRRPPGRRSRWRVLLWPPRRLPEPPGA
jgi:hypothetical protein